MPWIALLGVYVTWFGLLASTFKRTHLALSLAIRVARFTGLPKDPTSPSRSRNVRELEE